MKQDQRADVRLSRVAARGVFSWLQRKLKSNFAAAIGQIKHGQIAFQGFKFGKI